MERRRRASKKSYLIFAVIVIVAFLFNVPLAILSTVMNSGRKRDFRLETFTDEWNIATNENKFEGERTRRFTSGDVLETCPGLPPSLTGRVVFNSSSDLDRMNYMLSEGGSFRPMTCKARYKVAIIIPIRDRQLQLRTLLRHMHPVWQRQEIEYAVYAVTQSGTDLFNRAKLMNVGVAEAVKEKEYDCYVFQDTDLLLEDDRCLYWCDRENPRHLARHVDKFSYRPLHYSMNCHPAMNPFKDVQGFGGVSMLTKEQFKSVNGYSNLYWGWGGEDDDMFLRLQGKGYVVTNPYGTMCSYRMIKHKHETTNQRNNGRFALLYHSLSRANEEGFSSLRYRVLSMEKRPQYTNITVDIGKPSKKMMDFMNGYLWWFPSCAVRMPWIVDST